MATHKLVKRRLDPAVAAALDRARRATAAMETHREAMAKLAAERREAVAEARQRLSVIAIADELGITRQNVHRLLVEAAAQGVEPAR